MVGSQVTDFSKTIDRLVAALLCVVAAVVYLLTLAPTVSFWDCGEFIATSHGLQVGHPPGAPFYQLMAHLFTLLAPSPQYVALFSNAFSAFSAAITVGVLYLSLRLMQGSDGFVARLCAVVGSLCYLFCSTAWFSAVESEVYAFAMLMAALIVYAALRYYLARSSRWLVLLSLLAGLSVGVHLLCLLALPAALLLVVASDVASRQASVLKAVVRGASRRQAAVALLCGAMFCVGLSVYLIVPIRAAANPPINCGNPSSFRSFSGYVNRDQYAHAPLYPRMWRHDLASRQYADSWSGGRNDLLGNVTYYVSYQLGYMYLRYLMWNFSGRYNSLQGYGSLQNGQFITGVPPIDRLLVGTSHTPPSTLPVNGRQVYYLLPFLLGLIGLLCPPVRRRPLLWCVALLFLFGGPLLNIYLNHPAYEPRERDYAYILSFYAFCLWIAFGAETLARWCGKRMASLSSVAALLMLGVPLLMACQNWPSHSRSGHYVAHNLASNIYACCPPDAVLITYGDNDTFPLWYVQQVEGLRPDVQTHNVNLMGYGRFVALVDSAMSNGLPMVFSHYAHDAMASLYPSHWQQVGMLYRLMPHSVADTVSLSESPAALRSCHWQMPPAKQLDEVSERFFARYWKDVCVVARAMLGADSVSGTHDLLLHAFNEVPPEKLHDTRLQYDILLLCAEAASRQGDHALRSDVTSHAMALQSHLLASLPSELAYFSTLSPSNQALLKYIIEPRREVLADLRCQPPLR